MEKQVDDRGTQAAGSRDAVAPGAVSLEAMMKGGALVCVVALGGVAVGLAVWALRRWMDEREYQAWRASVAADPYRRDRNGFPVGAQLGYSRTR
jgi:hypothetical protein